MPTKPSDQSSPGVFRHLARLFRSRPGAIKPTRKEKRWLRQKHPEIKVTPREISGVLEFSATYNEQSGFFLILDGDAEDTVGGTRLEGKFKIHIKERQDQSFSKLPAVRVEEVETVTDRHFNQIDQSACLGSPLEEEKFLQPRVELQPFLERLVIPFLYGQLFYTAHHRWPWSEYMHGATGVLESYLKVANAAKAKECLQQLQRDGKAWPKIKLVLMQDLKIKGHAPCFCERGGKIRNCHPDALKGLQQLRKDIAEQKIPII